jgi:hypothetical protein
MARKTSPTTVEQIETSIHEVRGHRVMLDADLARIYGVETRALVQAIKRNAAKFPDDFAFQLTNQEVERLISQFVISNAPGRGGTRKPPWVFTEHGTVMAATVLRSPAAIEMSVYVVRAFIHMRRTLVAQSELAEQLRKLERGLAATFGQYDEQFRSSNGGMRFHIKTSHVAYSFLPRCRCRWSNRGAPLWTRWPARSRSQWGDI